MANLTGADVELTVVSGSNGASSAENANYNSFVFDTPETVATTENVVKEVVIWITNEIETAITIDWTKVSSGATHKIIEFEPAPANEATHVLQGANFVEATTGATHKKLAKPKYESVTSGATHKGVAQQIPDIGYYNGIDEYQSNNKFYSKTNSSAADASKTSFPIFKAYIYKGDGLNAAREKLEQDVANNNKSQAEAEFLYFARHSGGAVHSNKTYFKTSSCLPPTGRHGQPDYYQLMFKTGGSGDKLSYRYRIVLPEADHAANFPRTTGNGQNISLANEHKNGAMNFLNSRNIEIGETTITTNARDASSFDPWKSKDMRGCHGVKTQSGGYVNDASGYSLYKNKYHAVNTWVEEKIPELKGIYGRRGFSDNTDSTDAKIKLEEPTDILIEYKAWVKVDPLPDVDHILGIV